MALLESGLDLDGLGRFSFLAARPLAVAVAEAGRPLELVAGPAEAGRDLPGDPLRGAAELIRRLAPGAPVVGAPFPFAGGGVLTLAYDLGRRFERLPAQATDDSGAPDLHLAVYGRVLGFDHATGEVRLLGPSTGVGLSPEEVERALAEARASSPSPAQGGAELEAQDSLAEPAYVAAVEEARRLIRRGDLFEVNLSRRYRVHGPRPERVYAALRELAPAPFMADLDLGRGRRLLSASPERFLALDPTGRISSWPIKGTRPRDPDPARDAALLEELLASEKEAAELAMIVDLVRNDLGRVAEPGTVSVVEPRGVQSWPTVHHTVAVVEAQLAADQGWADLVRAAFPPGSVTGAPKIRAMEVIDALEPVRRGLYCGAFGYVGWDDRLDLAVAIRILSCASERIDAHAGGAVLLASDPSAEEAESRTKAGALLRALAAGAA